MVALTDAGYLHQPHTSAGRTPTEEGYRFFVSQLMGKTILPEQAQRTIQHQFYQARHDFDQWMRLAASILARQSQAASLVTSLHPEHANLKHLELIATRGRQVLMVLVFDGGEVQRLMECTFTGCSLTKCSHDHLIGVLILGGECGPGCNRDSTTDDTIGTHDTFLKIRQVHGP